MDILGKAVNRQRNNNILSKLQLIFVNANYGVIYDPKRKQTIFLSYTKRGL